MRAPRWFLVSLAIAGCASAGKGNRIIGGIIDADPGTGIIGGIIDAGSGDPGRDTDANDFPQIDAGLIDAPPQQITLTQNVSTTVTRANTFVCLSRTQGLTAQNSFYRVFTLDEFDITTVFHVTQVDFAIELASAGPSAVEQPAQVILASYGVAPTGTTLDPAQIRTLTSIDITIPDGAGTRMSVPITGDVAPGTRLLVELAVPDGTAAGRAFVIGSNAQGERGPGYISTSGPDCAVPIPTTMASIRVAHPELMLNEADILLSVTGTH
jgi:hypothetical protein